MRLRSGTRTYWLDAPHHGIPFWMQVQTFYNGLLLTTRTMVDAAIGVSLNSKTLEQSANLFKVMASNNYQGPSERTQKTRGVLDIDTTTLMAQLQALTMQNVAIRK